MKILCDTHVHCYDFEQLPSLLDSALLNFKKQGAADAYVLFFTDGLTDRTWSRLKPLAEQGTELNSQLGAWACSYSASTGFISARKEGAELLLAPARQVNSAARLEYLLLGCDHVIAGGMQDDQLLKEYGDQYAVVCPWGTGKWLGSRGKLLSELIDAYADKLLLGDNGGRPALWRWVPQFKQTKRGVLNGSDPLPIDGELGRIAAFGILLNIDTQQLTVLEMLNAIKSTSHTNYGKNLGLVRFVLAQFQMLRA